MFGDTFIESQGAKTVECWRDILQIVYTAFIKCTYNFMMFFCGICVVTYWGILYSILTWFKIWCLAPMTTVVLVFVKGGMPVFLEPITMCRKVCCGRRKN